LSWLRQHAAVALLLTAITAAGQSSAERRSPTPIRYAASVVGTRSGGGQEPTVEIAIERWSSWTSEQRLIATLAASSRQAFLGVLATTERHGVIEMPDGSAYVLHYAQEHVADNGLRQVIAAADRPFEPWVSATADATEYPFGFVEIT
jgi:hypothetical protein